MKQAHYDLVILGSGSTAFAAALRAQELGKTSVTTEERTTGGTCVNRGCLPSKNLIEAAKIIHDARHPRYPGLTPAEVKFNFHELIVQKDDVIHGYRKKKYESLVGGQFSIEEGHAEFLDDNTITVGGKRLTGEKILIASGSRPVMPVIKGLDQVPYLTSDLLTNDEPMELWELPRSLIILGGGYIALELGQMFHRFGTEVTLLQRSKQLLAHGYEPEVGEAIREVFEKEGIKVMTSATALSVRQDGTEVTVEVETGNQTLPVTRRETFGRDGPSPELRPNRNRKSRRRPWQRRSGPLSMNSCARTCRTSLPVATLSAAKSAARWPRRWAARMAASRRTMHSQKESRAASITASFRARFSPIRR